MLPIVVLALLTGAPHHRLVQQPNLTKTIGEAAPAFAFASPTTWAEGPAYTGLPATDGCKSASAITGLRGEALTFTRATSRFCPDDIPNEATGTMCTSGQVCLVSRRMGNFVAATNICLRSEEFDNAAWADVGTPSTSANAYAAPDGATTAEQITDNDGAAFEGRSQAITTTAQTKHQFSVWFRCNTGSCEARTRIVGAGNSAGDASCTHTGLTTAWKRVSCISAAAYGAGLTSVTVYVESGDAAGDQYTLGIWGAMHTTEVEEAKLGPYVATTSASAARNSEVSTFAFDNAALASAGSASADGYFYDVTSNYRGTVIRLGSGARLGYTQYFSGKHSIYDGTTEGILDTLFARERVTHLAFRWGVGGSMSIWNVTDNETKTVAFDGAMPTTSNTSVGYSADTLNMNGYIGNVCIDSSTSKCYQ